MRLRRDAAAQAPEKALAGVLRGPKKEGKEEREIQAPLS
eukprot:CAMPEP_0198694706 /NCGR_PEP_ID=MMETSP1468-20131203/274846_1 /TAXON_ID=1461545 /ORGANISM="Mantoniella sp, Strain CCMP1436" /LENGTH=38 /DNA_ID= /DNA_START= /DNA_END= /DNA_ORIENTATION=